MEEPALWKLGPEVVTKPWGLLHAAAAGLTGIEVGVGEFWLASAQTGPGNYSNAVVDPSLRRTLADLLREKSDNSEEALRELIGPAPLEQLRKNPHRGKTEAWYVRSVEGRCGVAAGPASEEDAEELQRIIRTEGLRPEVESWSEEVRHLLGLIEPLEGGEVFLVPAGTLHTMFAVGHESYFVVDELQQGYGEALLPTLSKILMVQDDLLSVQVHPDDDTVARASSGELGVNQDLEANPTVRVYDFGRRPGEYPELGFRLVDPEAGLRRISPLELEMRRGLSIRVMMADSHLLKCRLSLEDGLTCGLPFPHGSYHVLHCLEGAAELQGGNRAMEVRRGETVFVPGCLEEELTITGDGDCAFFDDSFPNTPKLSAFLAAHGATVDQIESLLSPPRVKQSD